MPGVLHVAIDGPLATLTLANPTKKNAIDPPLCDALIDAVRTLPGRGVRAAVLTSEGTIFSSGYDLDALQLPTADAAQKGRTRWQGPLPLRRAVEAIATGTLPIVAALPGLAIGGGCELACACDLRVAHRGVALAMPPVRLGIVYPEDGLRRFVALIGAAHTRELFLTAARIPAERALAWGLVDHVVDESAVLPVARELATAIAQGDPAAIAGTRRLLAKIV